MTEQDVDPRPVIDCSRFDAVIFDMDGVVTDTAKTHAAAWSRLFDEFLAPRAHTDNRPFTDDDYRRYVDGRPRLDGVRLFLESRDITLPFGEPVDVPGSATIWGLANAKNQYFHDELQIHRPQVFPSSIALAELLRAKGMPLAVVTASRNREAVLAAAGVARLFSVHVDGVDADALGLAGKPDPATFLEASRRLHASPDRTVIIEDATSGIEGARKAGFGLIVAVDHGVNADALLAAGAHYVVSDLADIKVIDSDTEDTVRADSEWTLSYLGYSSKSEGQREALCTIGNGIFATRGAGPETEADNVHYPGTYAAGLYNRLVSNLGGTEFEHESLVNLPNWLPLSFRPVGGTWLDLDTMGVSDYRQDLDLRHGILSRNFEVTDADGHTTALAERRLAHMGQPHIAALEWTITPKNWSGRIEILSGLDANVANRNVAAERDLAGRHLHNITTGNNGAETLWITAQTRQSQRHIGIACRTQIDPGPLVPSESRQTIEQDDKISHHLELDAQPGVPLRIEKIAAIATSLDDAISNIRTAVLDQIDDAPPMDLLVSSHVLAWKHLWQRVHVELEDHDSDVARNLNLHTFHVVQTLSPHITDRDVGVGARGLHGEGYRGHVFWDELFVFPYLNSRIPELTRELLLYRYRRLPAARRMATALGCRGARYPWQSGSDGSEETPTQFFNPRSQRWMADNSQRQHHVGLAVAYEVWQYYQATGDLDFLANYGAEMMTEITRFWVDLADLDAHTGRYSIRGIMGPDEFHDGYPDRPGAGIDNNAYTNVLVSWLLRRMLEVRQLLEHHRGAELWQRLHLEDAEVTMWEQISRRLRVPFHPDGIISQFDGYEKLAEFEWEQYRRRYGNIGRLDLILDAEGDSPNRYKLSKQADVLMLLYLFSTEELTDLFDHLDYPFDPNIIPAIVEYYTDRTSNGSTLSRVVNAWVLARGDRHRSWGTFREALLSDVADIQGGTTREGVHLGAMAATIDLVQRCYTGIRIHDDTLWFAPQLPEQLRRLRFPLRYRNHHLDVSITSDRIHIHAQPGPAASITVGVDGKTFGLEAGHSIDIGPPTRP